MYDEEEVLEMLRELEEEGEKVTMKNLKDKKGLSHPPIKRLFGSIGEARKKASVEKCPDKYYQRIIKEVEDEYGYVSRELLEKEAEVPYERIRREFKGVKEISEETNIDVRLNTTHSVEKIERDLRYCLEKYDNFKIKHMNEEENTVSFSTVEERLDNLEEILQEYGIKIQDIKQNHRFDREFDISIENATSHVYCLEVNSEEYYVGCSSNVKKRIKNHLHGTKTLRNIFGSGYKITDIITVKPSEEKTKNKERELYYDVCREKETKKVYGGR